MSSRFTLGIEEEFQLVDRHTGQLSSHILTMLEKGVALFGEKIKAEMLQSTVEIVTDVCPNILTARLELQHLRANYQRWWSPGRQAGQRAQAIRRLSASYRRYRYCL